MIVAVSPAFRHERRSRRFATSSVFGGDINRFSHMMAFSGAGAVCGALVVAWLGRFRHMGIALLLVQVVFGALIVGANKMQRAVQIPSALITALNGLLVVFVVSSELWRKRLMQREQMAASRESAPAPPVESEVAV